MDRPCAALQGLLTRRLTAGVKAYLAPADNDEVTRMYMDFRRADLHTHTQCSDGRLSPSDLVALARQAGLRALAITDHDTVDGVEEGQAAGRACGVEVIAGVELSVTVGNTEIHLLGYFFDPTHHDIRAHLVGFQKKRYARAEQMVERLQGLGVGVSFASVLHQAEGGTLGRPHVARALLAGGHVKAYGEAFERYLHDQGPAFVEKPLFPARDALAMLHEAGGLGVLAHPGHWTSTETLMALIRAGLDGIETIHPAHDQLLTHYYRRITRDHRLLETGGSDYHGYRPGEEENLGRYSLSYARLERIRAVVEELRVT